MAFFVDTFTEASTIDLATHTPDTGTSWTQLQVTGTRFFQVLSGGTGLRASGNAGDSGFIYTADATYPGADYEVEFTFKGTFSTITPLYAMARIQDAENMYAVRMVSGSNGVQLYKKVSGTWSTLGSAVTVADGSVVKLSVNGTAIKVYDDGAEVISVTDSSITSAGKAGLGHGGGAELVTSTDDTRAFNMVDTFSVTDLGGGGVGLALADAHVTTQTDAVSLSQVHNLTVNDASVVTQADAVTNDHDYLVTNSNWFFSPGNWYKSGSTYAQTNNMGAYMKIAFNGTGLTLKIDMTQFNTLSQIAARYPVIAYRTDGGAFTTFQLASSTTERVIATGLSSGPHQVEIYFKALGDQDQWSGSPPPNALRVTGIRVHAGTIAAPTLRTQRWLAFGDSITEGVNVTGDDYIVLQKEGHRTWAIQLAEANDAEIGIVAYIAQGWATPGITSGNVPEFHDAAGETWDEMYSGVSRDFTGIDTVLVNFGANDAGVSAATIKAHVTDFLTDFHAAHSGIDVYIILPFGDPVAQADNIAEGYWDFRYANPSVTNKHLILIDQTSAVILDLDLNAGTGGTTYSHDDLHPNQAGHDALATLLDDVLFNTHNPLIDFAHVVTQADNVTVTQVGGDLAVSDSHSTTQADPITLTQVHNLAVQDAAVITQADSVTLSQAHALAVQDGSVVSQVDEVVLDQANNLSVENTHSTTQADAVSLSQVHNLTAGDAHSTTQADNITLSQAHALAVQDAASTSQADAVALSQAHSLAVQDAASTSQVDPVVITQAHNLTVDDGSVVSQADAVTITQAHNLTVQDAASTSQVDPLSLSGAVELVPADAYVSTQADPIALTQVHTLAVNDASCISQVDPATVTQVHAITPADTYSTTQADAVTLDTSTVLAVADAFVTVQADPITLSQVHMLTLADAFVITQADSIFYPSADLEGGGLAARQAQQRREWLLREDEEILFL